jgi:hypothetical protein
MATTILAYAEGAGAAYEIPGSVSIVGAYAFRENPLLTSVTFPLSTKYLYYNGFWGCSSLTTFTYLGTVEQWGKISAEASWNGNAPAKEVLCSDGSVALS